MTIHTHRAGAALRAKPISGIDLERARTRCERIRAGFRGLYDWIPVRPLRGAGVARWTGLKDPLCRRVLAAVQHNGDPIELARILPGVDGLTLFVDALERLGCPASRIESARQAMRAFAELMHDGGGSQRRLLAAIRRSLEVGDEGGGRDSDHATAQERLFEAARSLTGASCETQVALSIVFGSKTRSNELDSVGALGRLGYRARPDAPPLIAKRYAFPEGADGAVAALPEMDLQQRFGTPDLDITQTRLDDERVLMTCETSAVGDEPIDLWIGPVLDRGIVRFESGEEGNGYSSLATLFTPSRTLVHDLWVEKPLAQASVLRAGVYRATPDVFASMDYKQWYDRLPGDPKILLLGSDLQVGVERTNPHHAEIVEQCFDYAGQDLTQFVGYRCIVEHPIWMAVYRLTLEFDQQYEPKLAD